MMVMVNFDFFSASRSPSIRVSFIKTKGPLRVVISAKTSLMPHQRRKEGLLFFVSIGHS